MASLGTEKPAAAITVLITISPLFVNLLEPPPHSEVRDNVLDDIRLCLSAVGPCPLLGPIQWFQFDDADLYEAGPRGFGSNRLEILPYSLPPAIAIDLNAARMIVSKSLS